MAGKIQRRVGSEALSQTPSARLYFILDDGTGPPPSPVIALDDVSEEFDVYLVNAALGLNGAAIIFPSGSPNPFPGQSLPAGLILNSSLLVGPFRGLRGWSACCSPAGTGQSCAFFVLATRRP